MRESLRKYTIQKDSTINDALRQIDANREGFLVVIDESDKVIAVLTDGDIRRAFIKGFVCDDCIDQACSKAFKYVLLQDSFETITEFFKNQSIKFLPIIDDDKVLQNIITKPQMHTILLKDIHADLMYDFFSLDTSIIDSEIFQRPWGFYKTTVLNDYYQSKVISVKPSQRLSLQSHNHREEHWVVVHGSGVVQLDQSTITVGCGSYVFIPKGAKHRLINTDNKDSLIVTEVQIGDYLGEDDIIRYEDDYGRI